MKAGLWLIGIGLAMSIVAFIPGCSYRLSHPDQTDLRFHMETWNTWWSILGCFGFILAIIGVWLIGKDE